MPKLIPISMSADLAVLGQCLRLAATSCLSSSMTCISQDSGDTVITHYAAEGTWAPGLKRLPPTPSHTTLKGFELNT
jgi:hypothetical protein